MKIIRLYELMFVQGPQSIQVPRNAEILTVQMSVDGVLCLWIKGDATAYRGKDVYVRREEQEFEEINERYLGTVQNRGYGWHIFISTEAEDAA